MTATTDLRAALREAAAMLESYSEIGFYSDAAKARAKVAEFRALADAPPTVAELLSRVDATHEVHWTDADGDEWRAIHVDSDGGSRIAIEMRSRDKQDNWWFTHYPLASDFLLPARLVEVSP